VIARPKLSLSSRVAVSPPGVADLLFGATVPSGFRNRMWTAPRSVPPSSSRGGADGEVGGAVAVEVADAGDRGAEVVVVVEGGGEAAGEVADLLFGATVPSGFRNRMWTAPRSVPPSSSPEAPTARSGVPSPSRSPIPATEMPNSSASSRVAVRPPVGR
jgi:hypothetical protein